MPVNKRKIEIGAWKRYETYNFRIARTLAGAIHKFQFEGRHVEIRLPHKPRVQDWFKDDAPISCDSYKDLPGRKVPIGYAVHEIDIWFSSGQKQLIREDALGKVNVTLFSPAMRKRLDVKVREYEERSDRAFQYWLHLLRWESGNYHLTQFLTERNRVSWGTYLIDFDSRKRFYRSPVIVRHSLSQYIQKRIWTSVQLALKQERKIPIWQTLVIDAAQKHETGDTRGFVLDLAIACEAVVRQLITVHMKKPMNPAFQNMVNQLPIGRILDDWQKLGFDTVGWGRIKPEKDIVRRVFDLRNKIMHRGNDPSLDTAAAIAMLNAVVKFIKYAEKVVIGRGGK